MKEEILLQSSFDKLTEKLVNTREYGNLVVTNIDDILQIIDKVLGDKND